ncbi:MAG: DUF6624 domain-containing protein [Saprospiraceae bacterium]
MSQAIFKDREGQVIATDSLRRITDPENYGLIYYQDKEGAIREIIIRPGSEEDRKFSKQLRAAMEEGPELRAVPIDCVNKASILQAVFDSDQKIRQENRFDPKADHANLEIIAGLIDQCGVPNKEEVDEEQMAGIWAVLQHANNRYRKQYLPQLEAAAERGDIEWGTIAMMKDRVLVEDGQPQIYGTQVATDPVTGANELSPLWEPEYVNQRRAAAGMGPLQDYLNRFGVRFDVPQLED